MNTIYYRSKSLDILRGIFACIVVLMHVDIFSIFKNFSIIKHAYVFVDFFFVLSAFVLYNSYRYKVNQSFYSLVVRRIKRLFPLHYFMLVIFLAFEFFKKFVIENHFNLQTNSFTNETSVSAFLTSIFLFDSFGLFEHNIWNAPSWSISAEFYSFIIFVLIDKANKHLRLPLFLGLGLFVFVYCLTIGTVDYGQKFGILRCLWAYFIVLILLESKFYIKLIGTFPKVISIILVLMYFIFPDILNFYEFLLPIPFAIIVFNLYYKKTDFGDFKFLNKIGDLSYSIYLTQAIVIIILDDLLLVLSKHFDKLYFVDDHLFYFQNSVISIILTFGNLFAVVLFSYFTNKYIENLLINNSNKS